MPQPYVLPFACWAPSVRSPPLSNVCILPYSDAAGALDHTLRGGGENCAPTRRTGAQNGTEGAISPAAALRDLAYLADGVDSSTERVWQNSNLRRTAPETVRAHLRFREMPISMRFLRHALRTIPRR